ncbi:TBC1 domain family member 22B [Anabarilius grahami]|uniref:TBC1 domain family member 22B n=1 Tax=Anabarilius grahami TaxID=495550 RepID=A0A3N0XM32_ANAGA|nr:TBC1 domain family member 22B [Anabarilius grahami]
MWKCGELNGSGISPVLWPVTYGPAHDRQGTPCFICGQRGLFTLLFQLFFPPASSFLSFSIRLFYLNPIRALTRPPSAVLPAAMQRFTDSFLSESLSREDNYTFAQPGIQIKVKALEELVSRIDEDVHVHFQRCEVEYLQFAFRWMNNLLMRELPLRCTIRLWDTYQVLLHQNQPVN